MAEKVRTGLSGTLSPCPYDVCALSFMLLINVHASPAVS